jgi:carbon monoxide dehydrogenase subunit G
MAGEYRIPAPRQRVWEALNDPEVLKAAITGCEQLDKISDEELSARVKAKVGPVSATFFGKVTLSDLNPPESYTISGEGSGGVAGFAKGGAKVHLADDGDGTVLTYAAKADVGGKLAQIGSRLVQGTAKKMADDFFGRFSRLVAERHGAEGAAAPAAAVGPAAALGTPPPVVAPPDVAAAIPPTMNVEATAGGVRPSCRPTTSPCRPAISARARPTSAPRPTSQHRRSRRSAPAARPRARRPRPARGASTVPQASAEAGLLQRPLTWVGIAVLVLALLFLIL